MLTLKNLHAHGTDCTFAGEESRTSLRRWFHHCTFYGFLLCFGATAVAAVYHWLGWPAPYDYTSLPVALGTVGGFGLLIGPAGLYSIGRIRDPETADPAQRPFDLGFIVLLFLSSLTGLALLMLRETQAMAALLIVHLGVCWRCSSRCRTASSCTGSIAPPPWQNTPRNHGSRRSA